VTDDSTDDAADDAACDFAVLAVFTAAISAAAAMSGTSPVRLVTWLASANYRRIAFAIYDGRIEYRTSATSVREAIRRIWIGKFQTYVHIVATATAIYVYVDIDVDAATSTAPTIPVAPASLIPVTIAISRSAVFIAIIIASASTATAASEVIVASLITTVSTAQLPDRDVSIARAPVSPFTIIDHDPPTAFDDKVVTFA